MRTFDEATAAHLATRPDIVARLLFWVRARNLTTGLDEDLGLWTGEDDAAFVIDGETRTYHAAGLLSVDPLIMETGLSVRMFKVSLNGLTAQGRALVRGYDLRLTPIQVHRAIFHPVTHALIGVPHRYQFGRIDSLTVTRPEKGGTALAEATVAPLTRDLTRVLPSKKSDATQQRRQADRFRRYADVSGVVGVWWGEPRSGLG